MNNKNSLFQLIGFDSVQCQARAGDQIPRLSRELFLSPFSLRMISYLIPGQEARGGGSLIDGNDPERSQSSAGGQCEGV